MKFFTQVNRIFFTAVILSSLVACSTNPYVAPTANQATATIKGFKTGTSINNSDVARIKKIDDLNNSDAHDYNKEIIVTAGTHTFTIETTVTRRFFSNNYSAESKIRTTLLAGHHYEVKTSTAKDLAKVWIVDHNGKINSEIVSQPLHMSKTQSPYMMAYLKTH